MDGDYLVRGLALGGQVRVTAVRSTATMETMRASHDASPISALALSRVATAALLLGATLKGRQQASVQLKGGGPLAEVYAIANADGHVRATCGDLKVPTPEGWKRNLGPFIGVPGLITVTKKLSADDPPFRGVVPLVDGEVARDLTEYLLQSEQIPSAVGLGEKLGADGVTAAGGFMVQALPGVSDESLATLERRLGSLPPVGELFGLGVTPEGVLDRLFDDVEILSRTEVGFQCTCSREHYARLLCTLGEAELKSLTEEQEHTEVTCQFCSTRYAFDRTQMNALIYGARMYQESTEAAARRRADDEAEPA
jgi:molecular chaperone Hsp33